MIRNALLTAFLATGLILASPGLAQEGQPPAPTPGPGEVVFVGTVQAPAGTTITLEALDQDTAEIIDCDSATTEPIAGEPSLSSFTLVAPALCASQLMRICWGADLCVDASIYQQTGGDMPGVDGQVIDLGLLDPSTFGQISDVPPHGDMGPTPGPPPVGGEASFPATGIAPAAAVPSERRSNNGWLLWAGVAALAGGLALAAGGLAAARRR